MCRLRSTSIFSPLCSATKGGDSRIKSKLTPIKQKEDDVMKLFQKLRWKIVLITVALIGISGILLISCGDDNSPTSPFSSDSCVGASSCPGGTD